MSVILIFVFDFSVNIIIGNLRINKNKYYDFIENMLPGIENNSMVTPHEIDEVVTNISEIIAGGINMALN